MAERIVFRDGAGRELTEADLATATGRVQWELVGGEAVPEQARRLHQEGREAGGRSDYRKALKLLGRAQELAPRWPHPLYDAAFTVLLQGDVPRAAELYAQVDRLAPRGFFTCKTTLDMLRRELRGELFPNFSNAFLNLEWMGDAERRLAVLRGITAQFPGFPPGWKELSSLLTDPAERLAALERGLAGDPDPDTRGVLLINKALLLQREDRAGAVAMLGTLALDPDSTLTTETMARILLAALYR